MLGLSHVCAAFGLRLGGLKGAGPVRIGFMNFSKEVIADHNKSHVPVCDDNYTPPLCSNLYHDQSQTPGYPKGDGNCLAPGCDVGSVPVGE